MTRKKKTHFQVILVNELGTKFIDLTDQLHESFTPVAGDVLVAERVWTIKRRDIVIRPEEHTKLIRLITEDELGDETETL